MSERFHESSDFLFARPSFLEGIARIVDFGNSLNSFNISRSPEEADTRAIASDWTVVGKDIRGAMVYLGKKEGKKAN